MSDSNNPVKGMALIETALKIMNTASSVIARDKRGDKICLYFLLSEVSWKKAIKDDKIYNKAVKMKIVFSGIESSNIYIFLK